MKMRKTPDPEMRWLKKLLPIAQSHGHAVVHSELVFFLNPRHRGENFKWANFVDLCVRSAETSVWQSFSTRDWNKYKDQIMDAAKRSARRAASDAMKTSGLLDSDAKTNPMTDSLPDGGGDGSGGGSGDGTGYGDGDGDGDGTGDD